MPLLVSLRAAALALVCCAAPAAAHEFWIEPVSFQVAQGDPAQARLYVGTMLAGDEYPFIGSTFVRFDLTDAGGTRPAPGELGDRPALQTAAEREGLLVVSYQSRPSFLIYKTWEKFTGFLDKEGLDGVAEAHAARGLPDKDFREAYTRFAKSLIAVGNGAGADAPLGLRLELVALRNPYAEDGPVEVEVLFEGVPRAGLQIGVFRRDAEGNVTREVMRSDAEGRAVIPASDAPLTLLSAVHMVEPEGKLLKQKTLVWHSLWASLSYGARLSE